MSKMKSLFAKVFKTHKSSTKSHGELKDLEFPTKLSTKYDIFQYLNFGIPELQLVKLSLEFDKEEKAFEQFFHYLQMRHSPASLCNWWKREEIAQTLKTEYTESVPGLLTAAKNILRHKFLLFSSHLVQADTPVRWNKSYEEGVEFDNELWKSGKPYTASELLTAPHNDIRFVWELNRHQHFLDLGKAYWYTGDEMYAKEFVQQINSWIDQNPYPLSVNWADSHEIALRGLYWIFGYTFFFRSEWLDEDFFCRFYQILLYHGHVIYKSLQIEPSPLPAHHLVAQATFLYLLGTLFPEYLYSKTWSTMAWDILQWKTPLLKIEAFFQHSVAFLIRVIELYCLVLVVRTNNRYHIPRPLNEGLSSILERLLPFIKPTGTLCRFGQDHPRQLTRGMYAQQHDNFQYVFSMAALLLKNTTMAAVGKTFHDSLLWFFGHEGLQEFAKLPQTAPLQQSCLIPNSPYAVMRSGWEEESGYCFISAGIDKNYVSQQQHSDLFSFELVTGGQECIIDSGPYSYDPGDEWNLYFRSVQAHNCIAVDGISHMTFQDPLLESSFDQWISTPTFDLLSGSHNGFEDLEEPVGHRRAIFYYKPNYWIFCDLLTGEGQHLFDQYFHFPSFRLNVDFSNKCVKVQLNQGRHFAVMPVNSRELDIAIFTGGETPDSGWLSGGYKKPIESPFIKYGKRAMAPTAFHTLICCYSHETPLDFSGRQLQVLVQDTPLLSDEVSALELSTGEETQYFVLLHQPRNEQIQIEHMTFQGTLFFLQQQGNTIVELTLCNATLLMMDGRILFQAATPIEHLALKFEDDTLHVTCLESYTFQVQFPGITQVFINKRKTSLKHEDDMLVVSTARV